MQTNGGSRVNVRPVAPGIHQIRHGAVNCFIVVEGERVGLVDAGLPRTAPVLLEALAHLGRRPADVVGIVITHGHFDHVGFARWMHEEHQTPIHAHRADLELVAHPYRHRPYRNRFLFAARHPGGWPHLASMTLGGALRVRGVSDVLPMAEGKLDWFPGRPELIHTPGHTDGQCVLHLADRSTVITGDALVTLDPYTGRRGPQIVAPAATNDPALAIRSLERIADTEAELVLTGHGELWPHGARSAVKIATRRSVPR